jgi:hypothetical protein
MKKLILALGVTLMTVCFVNAQDANAPASVNKNAPVINFDKTTHDYGTVTKGGDGACEFKFKNTGVEPLILSNVTSSCGCTVPEWPREPILKGKSNVIKVKYDTNRVGPINKTVTVVSNATNTPVQLHIIGTVVDKVDNTAMPVKTEGTAPVAK